MPNTLGVELFKTRVPRDGHEGRSREKKGRGREGAKGERADDYLITYMTQPVNKMKENKG